MGDLGTGAHRNAQISSGQCWCVVEAITHHRHRARGLMQPLQFVLRPKPPSQLIGLQGELLAKLPHRALTITAEHGQGQAIAAQLGQGLSRIGSQGIAHSQKPQKLLAMGQGQHRGPALLLLLLPAAGSSGHRNTVVLEPSQAPQAAALLQRIQLPLNAITGLG